MREQDNNAKMARTSDQLAELIAGRYVDRETGKVIQVPTRSLVIADTIAGSEADLVAELGFGRRLAVLSDPDTHSALGARVERALTGRFEVESLQLRAAPKPDSATVERVRQGAASADALIAVGSGTINDLAKYASALDGKPYAVFATAPSMNGFTSLTASITVHGHKKTIPAHAPAGAFFDLTVLAAAPERLIRAGLGDSICRTTAQWDWLLSHLLLGTDYRELPFELLRDDEPELLAQTRALVRGDIGAMRALVRTLVLSGTGTAIVGISAPASQAEHLVSHYIDMLEPAGRPAVFHGEQVGVATLAIARLQERMLERALTLQPDRITDAELRARYGSELGASISSEFSSKRLGREEVDALNHRLERDWNTIRERLAAVMLGPARIEAALRSTGAPTNPQAIHLKRSFFEEAIVHAREIRNRYTVLDLAAQADRLDTLVPTL